MKTELLNKQEVTVSVITLLDRKLVIPSNAIIEVIPLSMPQLIAKMPKWFLGYLPWQGMRVPFISFEAASETSLKINNSSCIAILKTITPNLSDSFFALLIQTTPQSLSIDKESLYDIVAELAPFELETVRLKRGSIDIIGKIPDILALEHLMIKTGVLR